MPAKKGTFIRRGSVKEQRRQREQQARALDLATIEGLTYDLIAADMGLKSKSSVHRLIHKALDDIPAKGLEAYRKREDARIEALMSVYMPAAMAGDLDAGKFVDALIGRRAKLMGINAPDRAPVDGDGNTVTSPPLLEVIVKRGGNAA